MKVLLIWHLNILSLMYEFVRSAEEIQEMIDEADRDHDGKVNLKDFLRIMRKRGDNPMDDLSSDDD